MPCLLIASKFMAYFVLKQQIPQTNVCTYIGTCLSVCLSISLSISINHLSSFNDLSIIYIICLSVYMSIHYKFLMFICTLKMSDNIF